MTRYLRKFIITYKNGESETRFSHIDPFELDYNSLGGKAIQSIAFSLNDTEVGAVYFFDNDAEDAEPDHDDTVKYCPDCETPNQFGELCSACEREQGIRSRWTMARELTRES